MVKQNASQGVIVTGAERWEAVVGYEGSYEVSDQGNVRSIDRTHYFRGVKRYARGVPLKPLSHPSGYRRVTLWKNGVYQSAFIHTLVLEAFVGPRPSGHEAAHGNGVKKDNRLENLRWATPSENQADRETHGTGRWGKPHVIGHLDAETVRRLRQHYLLAPVSITELAAHFGLPRTTVADVVKRRTWRWA